MDDAEQKTVLELLADEYARAILAHTSLHPLSAQELQERCDASERTIYRRLDRLEELDLLEEGVEIDPDGHHRTIYETALKNVLVELRDGQYKIHIRLEEDTADRFARLWKGVRED